MLADVIIRKCWEIFAIDVHITSYREINSRYIWTLEYNFTCTLKVAYIKMLVYNISEGWQIVHKSCTWETQPVQNH